MVSLLLESGLKRVLIFVQPPHPDEARSLVSVSVLWVRLIMLTTDDT